MEGLALKVFRLINQILTRCQLYFITWVFWGQKNPYSLYVPMLFTSYVWLEWHFTLMENLGAATLLSTQYNVTWSPFYHKISNGCLKFIFYQKYFLWKIGLTVFFILVWRYVISEVCDLGRAPTNSRSVFRTLSNIMELFAKMGNS